MSHAEHRSLGIDVSPTVPVVISVEDLHQLVGQPQVVIADVRWYLDDRDSRKMYAEGHIPGAIFVDLERDLASHPSDLPTHGRHPFPSPNAFAGAMSRLGISDATHVIAYDDTGGMTAARLVVMLRMLGRNASLLDGGITAWTADSGNTLQSGKPTTTKSAIFTPQNWGNRLVTTEALTNIISGGLTTTRTVLLDARAKDRFEGLASPTFAALDPQAGHIPGAYNAPWTATRDEQTSCLKPIADLITHYNSLCVDLADDVIAYCGSGISACLNVVALEHAGFPVPRLYAASWSGWSADTHAAIQTGSYLANRAHYQSAPRSMGTAAIRSLRRTRQKNRLAELEWFEALYRVYLAAFIFGGSILFISGLVPDTEVSTKTANDVLTFGPGWLGLAGIVAMAMGLRSGSRGGPLSIEEADVRHVLLAPVSRSRVLLRPAIQRLRTTAFATAGLGAVAGQLAGRRLPGTEISWALSGAVWGAVAGLLFVATALCAHSLRLRGWMASILGGAIITWQITSALAHSSITGPGDLYGGLALWGERTRAIETLPILIAGLLMFCGIALLERQSLEALSRRSALVSQLRFAVTLQDLRTVTLLRRQLSQERSRSRPWLKLRRNRGLSVEWQRGWQGILRFPSSRLIRIFGLAVIAGLCQVAIYKGTTTAVVGSGLALFVIALELCEPLSQEIDQGERTDAYPKIRGVIYLSLMSATLISCIPVIVIMVLTMGISEPQMWTLAAMTAPLMMIGALAGACINIVSGAPNQMSTNAQANMMPPEVAGTLSLIKAIWPLVLCVLASLPMVGARSAITQGRAPESAAISIDIAVLLLAALIASWVRFRDDIKKFLNNAAAESRGQKSRTGAR